MMMIAINITHNKQAIYPGGLGGAEREWIMILDNKNNTTTTTTNNNNNNNNE